MSESLPWLCQYQTKWSCSERVVALNSQITATRGEPIFGGSWIELSKSAWRSWSLNPFPQLKLGNQKGIHPTNCGKYWVYRIIVIYETRFPLLSDVRPGQQFMENIERYLSFPYVKVMAYQHAQLVPCDMDNKGVLKNKQVRLTKQWIYNYHSEACHAKKGQSEAPFLHDTLHTVSLSWSILINYYICYK